jgi:hypothetical protein
MGHKNLLVTHTLYRLKGYSEAHAVASAAPAASFKPAARTSDRCQWTHCGFLDERIIANALTEPTIEFRSCNRLSVHYLSSTNSEKIDLVWSS